MRRLSSSKRSRIAMGMILLLCVTVVVQPMLSLASERKPLLRFRGAQQSRNDSSRKVPPMPPERGVASGLQLPNLDEVRHRQRQAPQAPMPIASTMRSRRKAGRSPQGGGRDRRSHHARSRAMSVGNSKALRTNPSALPGTPALTAQSGPPTFTNDPLKNPNDPESYYIKAVHITELRYWIDGLRNRRGYSNYPWAKPTASGGAINSSVLISWEPIDEMRTALNQAVGAPANGYAQGLALGQPILAAHIQELRDRVKETWDGSSLVDQLVPARIDLFNQSGNQIRARDCEWGIPLISLPGRAGLDLGIGISYSSLVWTRTGSYISFDDDHGDPSPGFKIGFPTVQGRYIDNQVGVNVYLLITSAGRRIELRRIGTSNVYEAGDSSYLQLIDYGSSLLVRTTDGTQMSYSKTGTDWHCTGIEDRNGNFISATYISDDLDTVTDTLGRVFDFNYDANGNLNVIKQEWSGGWRDMVTFGWGTKTLHPAFSGYTINGAYDGEVIPVLTQVGLLDGSHYNFDYNDYGQVSTISRYAADGPPGVAGDMLRSYFAYNYEYPPGDCPRITAARVWAQNWNNPINGVPAEVITYFADNGDGSHQMTTPDNTVYKEFYGNGWRYGLVTSAQVISGSTVQKTTTTSWKQDNEGVGYQTNPRVDQTLVSDGTNTRKTTIGYQTFTLPISNVSCSLPNDVYEYAADQTTVLRRTHTDYNLDTSYIDPNYLNLNRRIVGLPSARLIYAGTSTLISKTTYLYDEGGEYLQNTSAPAIQHDDYKYPVGVVVGRGNVTKVIRWDVDDPSQSANTANKIAYDITGNAIFTRDALNHQTSISYADKFSADGVNLDAPRVFSTFAYPTMVTDADGFSSSVWYNYDFGAQTRAQGPPPQGQQNGIIQTFTYDEATRLKRATTVNTGAYVHYGYGPYYTSSFASVNSVAPNYWQSDMYMNQFFDGLGRVFAVSSNHPNSSGGNKAQYTRYDVMGRAVQQTNPFEMDSGWNPTGDDAAGYQFNVANTFDWQGRPLRTHNMDGTYKEASYSGCGCAGGEVVTLTDEGTTLADGTVKVRQQKIYSDVLGRQWKTEVLNWDGSGPFGTGGSVYSTTVSVYNARDQVTLVRQFAGTDQSQTYQDTTMSYDGYGRVQSKHVPEQNAGSTTTWTYKPDDAVESVTDARGASATYVYNNGRHLVNEIHYSAPSGITPTSNVSFGYDAAGNRTSMTDGFGSQSYSYNELSQMTSETRTFNDIGTFTLAYDYNFAGALKSVSDPWGATVNYGFDSTGRLSNITGSGYGSVSQFLSSTQYRAWGTLKSETYGNGLTQAATYNSRMQMTSFEVRNAGIQLQMSTTTQFYADGQVKFSHNALDERFDRAFAYDHAVRTTEAYSGSQARDFINNTNSGPPTGAYRQSYQYNSFDQISQQTNRLWSQTQTTTNAYLNNRREGWTYDAAGFVTRADEMSYTRDAAGRKVQADNQDSHGSYGFDGDGRMLKMNLSYPNSGGGTVTINQYYLNSTALGGRTVAELNGSGQKGLRYVYAGGRKLAEEGAGVVGWSHQEPITGSRGDSNSPGAYIPQSELNADGVNVGFAAPDAAGFEVEPNADFGALGMGTHCSAGNSGCLTCYFNGFEHDCGQVTNLARAGALNIQIRNLIGESKYVGVDVVLGRLHLPKQWTREQRTGGWEYDPDDLDAPPVWNPTVEVSAGRWVVYQAAWIPVPEFGTTERRFAHAPQNPAQNTAQPQRARSTPTPNPCGVAIPTNSNDRAVLAMLLGEASTPGESTWDRDQSGVRAYSQPTGTLSEENVYDEMLQMVAVVDRRLTGWGQAEGYSNWQDVVQAPGQFLGYGNGQNILQNLGAEGSGNCLRARLGVAAIKAFHDSPWTSPFYYWKGIKQRNSRGQMFIRARNGAWRWANTDFQIRE